jgi:hypothetical protein
MRNPATRGSGLRCADEPMPRCVPNAGALAAALLWLALAPAGLSGGESGGFGAGHDLPDDVYWLLVAAGEVQRQRFDAARARRLQSVWSPG